MIKLFQIRLSREEVDLANKTQRRTPKMLAHSDAAFDGTFTSRAHYTHVADLDVADLDEAFDVSNIGPEHKITRHALMHSGSVGDVMVLEDGRAFIVKPIGFEEVKGWA